MEVFNKIYSQVSSSVSSTVSQLSGVLPGNPVTREFDATCHIASGGPGLLWKIYKGTKRSTKQEAAIFVFEKRQLDKWNKADRDYILEVIRRGITQLTKIRHPQVLTVQHPLEESRESLAFATEPVFASLSNVLGETFNMPQPANMSDYKFYDIEIKYGLLQIGEGLAFLHNDVKLLHKNISPESIIINQQGAWKLFGFDFCVHNTSPANSQAFYPYDDYSPTLPTVSQPNLDYMAPECVLTQNHSTSSDIFSLGMLAFSLHSPGGHPFANKVKDLQQFKKRTQHFKQISDNKLLCIPDALKEYVKMMLNIKPDVRPDAHQFIRVTYFEDVGVKTLNYLDSLLQWDNLQKSQFYKGLPEALIKLPQRVQIQRVVPCLVRDLQQPAMVPFVLPNILDIAQNCTQDEYIKCILPYLKPVMKLVEPVQILLIFLQRMELLLKQTPAEDIQQHVLPMLYRGLDSNTPQIHELCLSVLPTFAGLLDHSNVKNSLLPRIKKLCLSTSSLAVRVNCLLCVGKLLEHLDKWLVLDEILPFLPQIPSREPAVLMGILGIYKLTLNHTKLGISKEVLASRILPFLIPLCIENGLSLAQFNALVALVKQMFQIVETEHRTKLEQLNSVTQERRSLEATMPAVKSGGKSTELDQVFSGLGLDSFVTNGPSALSQEGKQKLSQQHHTIQLLQNQPSLEPEPLMIPKSSFQPKDLTAALSQTTFQQPMNLKSSNSIGSHLSRPVNTWNNEKNDLTKVVPSPSVPNQLNKYPQIMSPITSPIGTKMPLNNMGNNQNNVSTNQWPNSSVFTGWQSSQAPVNNFNNDTHNWSALDNLLPTSGTSRTPMNQMNINKPLLQSSIESKGNSSLSYDDIMDLLS